MNNFSPLNIKNIINERDLTNIYFILSNDGIIEEIKAYSAAEAAHKSSIKQPLKIINAGLERKNLIKAGVLRPNGESIKTSIKIESEPKEEFIVADLTGEDKKPKKEFKLLTIDDFSKKEDIQNDAKITPKIEEQELSKTQVDELLSTDKKFDDV